jgi:hypothetical protein
MFEQDLGFFSDPDPKDPLDRLGKDLKLSFKMLLDLPISEGKEKNEKDEDRGSPNRSLHGEGFYRDGKTDRGRNDLTKPECSYLK